MATDADSLHKCIPVDVQRFRGGPFDGKPLFQYREYLSLPWSWDWSVKVDKVSFPTHNPPHDVFLIMNGGIVYIYISDQDELPSIADYDYMGSVEGGYDPAFAVVSELSGDDPSLSIVIVHELSI